MPSVTEPPGLLIYSWISLSGSWASRYSSWATTRLQSVETVTADCERDNFMTAEEAKEYGLIDKVIYSR